MLGTEGNGAMAGQDILHMLRHLEFSHLWEPVLKPMLIGSLPLAAVSAAVFYVAAFYAARLFQSRRQMRRQNKLRARSVAFAEDV